MVFAGCSCQELAHAELVRALKLDQAKELTKLRQEFELQARELGSKYEKKMKMLRDDLELRRKQEIHEIEERKVGTGSGWLLQTARSRDAPADCQARATWRLRQTAA